MSEEETRRLEGKLDRILDGMGALEKAMGEVVVRVDSHATDLDGLKRWQQEELRQSGERAAELKTLTVKCAEQQTQLEALKRSVYIGTGMAVLIGASGVVAGLLG